MGTALHLRLNAWPTCLGIIAVAITACGKAVPSMAPVATSVRTDCWYYFDGFTGYVPQEPASLDELPRVVRDRVTSYLKQRVGDEVYARLRFAGGEVIDLGELLRREPERKSYKWTPPTYSLHFHLPLPEKDIDHFCAQLELGPSGQVLQDLTLPRIAAAPSKANIVSRDQAAAEAGRMGVPIERAVVELGYDPSADSMVWLFSHATRTEGSRFGGATCYINAHTGRFVKWSQYEGVT